MLTSNKRDISRNAWNVFTSTRQTHGDRRHELEAKDVFTKHKPHAGRRMDQKWRFLSLLTLTFDLWNWHSNLSEQGTKHVFPVNLAQIRSAVPEIFHTQTKKSQRQKQNFTQFTACGKNEQKLVELLGRICWPCHLILAETRKRRFGRIGWPCPWLTYMRLCMPSGDCRLIGFH